jgi:hypothetical protein
MYESTHERINNLFPPPQKTLLLLLPNKCASISSFFLLTPRLDIYLVAKACSGTNIVVAAYIHHGCKEEIHFQSIVAVVMMMVIMVVVVVMMNMNIPVQ